MLIGAGNYGFTLAVVRLLHPAQFSAFAAGQAVLLVIGNAAMAAVPWAVARYITVEDRPYARSEAMRFGLRASALQAVVAAAISWLVLVNVSGPAVATVTAAGAALMSLSAGPVGYLQGIDQVERIAYFRMLEAVARIGSGLLGVLLISRTASFGLIGFAVGGAVMFGLTLAVGRQAWPLHKPDAVQLRSLVHQSLNLGAVQLLMCMLGALDTVAAAASRFSADTAGGYQAAALLGRTPLFISTALSIAVYTELTRAPSDQDVGQHMRRLLWFYVAITLPLLLACCTVPHQILSLLIPKGYTSAATLLRYTSVSGAAIGVINCLTTCHQARGRFRPAISILAPAAVLQPILLIWLGRFYGITAFAIGLVSLSLVTLVAITWDSRRWLYGLRGRVTPMLPLTIGLAATAAVVRSPAIWVVAIVGFAGCLAFHVKRYEGAPVQAEEDQLSPTA